jgi:hypothetical protein
MQKTGLEKWLKAQNTKNKNPETWRSSCPRNVTEGHRGKTSEIKYKNDDIDNVYRIWKTIKHTIINAVMQMLGYDEIP